MPTPRSGHNHSNKRTEGTTDISSPNLSQQIALPACLSLDVAPTSLIDPLSPGPIDCILQETRPSMSFPEYKDLTCPICFTGRVAQTRNLGGNPTAPCCYSCFASFQQKEASERCSHDFTSFPSLMEEAKLPLIEARCVHDHSKTTEDVCPESAFAWFRRVEYWDLLCILESDAPTQ
jgi:hypothetical protein